MCRALDGVVSAARLGGGGEVRCVFAQGFILEHRRSDLYPLCAIVP